MRLYQAFNKANHSLKLLQKLYIGFGAILLVFSFVTFTYVRQSRAIKEDIKGVNLTAEILQLATGLEKSAVDSETGLRGYQITEDTSFLEPYYRGQRDFAVKISKLEALIIDADQLRRLAKIDSTYQRWQTDFAEPSIKLQSAALASPENVPAFNNFLLNAIKKGKGKKIMDSFRKQVVIFNEYEQQIRNTRLLKLQDSILLNNILAISLTALCVLAGIFIAIAVGSVFKKRLHEIASMAQEIARGNFDAKIKSDRVDEISEVTDSLNIMADQLNESFSNLSKLNKELDQFAYVVSHDLKAPLRAINSLAEWIEDDMPEVQPDVKRNLELMRGRVLRMESLINGILSYSKIGRKELPQTEVSVEILIDETKDSLNLPENSLTIAGKLPELRTERILLQQVFANLIGNAIKYNDKPEPLIQIGSRKLDNFYEFYVQDNGPGIPAAYHEKIFGVFQTMESRDTRESTGIGLAIVKKIVHEKGGRISLTSTEGKGSRFTFTWPEQHIKVTGNIPQFS